MKRKLQILLMALYTTIFKKLFKGQSVNIKDSFQVNQRDISSFFNAPIIFSVNIIFNRKSFIAAITFVKSKILDSFSNVFKYFFVFNIHTANRDKTIICFYGIYYAILRECFSNHRIMKLFFILIVLFPFIGFAQPYETNPDFNRTRNWHFGHGAGLRFDPDSIYQVQTSIHTDEAAAVHTSKDGDLLLYSNGESIWNAEHQVIHNGNLLLGHHSSNLGSVFVFHENNPDSIYLFNTYYNISTTKEFSVNLIVREADTFRVVYKDSVLMYSVCEPIAVVKANNGKDIWITVHEFGANNLYSYLLTSQGVVPCPVVSKSFSIPFGSPQAAYFDMVFSVDGKHLIKSNTNLSSPIINRIELYSFNNLKGIFEFVKSFDSMESPYTGLNFLKNNNNILVVQRDLGVKIYDYIINIQFVKTLSTSGFLSGIQNTTYGDNMLWISSSSYNLAMIINSDSISLREDTILLDKNPRFDFPNFNRSYYHTPSVDFAYDLNCISNIIQFYGQDTFNSNSHNWLFTKQGVTPITNNTKEPLIQFEDTGTYEVRYIASNGSRTDTVVKKVEVLPKIEKYFLGNDTGWCELLGSSIAINAPIGMLCYEWNTGESTPNINADTTGVYLCKITTPNFCVIYDMIKVSVDTIPSIPSIFKDNDTLKTNAIADRYQWLKDGSPTGTNSQRLDLNDTGVYSLKIISNGGCYAISDTIHIPDTSTNSIYLIELKGIKIYPNPFNNTIFIESTLEIKEVRIINTLGQLVYLNNIPSQLKDIETTSLENGFYIVILRDSNQNIYTYKLIKQKE
jgi:hypothetical protein